MPEDDFDPSSYPLPRLYFHVLQKGFQLGSVIGVAAVLPVLSFRAYRASGSPMLVPAAALAAMARSALWGTAFSGALAGAKTLNMDKEGLEDRVYRLHFNQGQNRVDRFAQASSLFGAAAAALLVNRTPLVVIGGAAIGTFVGTVAHVVTSPKDSTENKMIHEAAN